MIGAIYDSQYCQRFVIDVILHLKAALVYVASTMS